jgi:predicted ester cyclase
MRRLLFLMVITIGYISCNESQGSSANSQEAREERNKNTALAAVRAFEAGKIDSVFKDVDPESIDYMEGSMAPIKGVDSAKINLKTWMDAVPNYKGSDFTAVADGDYVMVYGEWSGTWQKEFMGMKPTGRSFTVKDVDIFKFNEAGKIIEHRSVQSNNEAARQLGMTIPNL